MRKEMPKVQRLDCYFGKMISFIPPILMLILTNKMVIWFRLTTTRASSSTSTYYYTHTKKKKQWPAAMILAFECISSATYQPTASRDWVWSGDGSSELGLITPQLQMVNISNKTLPMCLGKILDKV